MRTRRPPLISVVAPVYNNAAQLPQLIAELAESLQRNRVEVILVDDGSVDNSWATIRQLKASYHGRMAVRGLRLSRNFGQHRALCAGLEAARGDYVFTLDADLQDDPAYMPSMLALALSGYEIVHARRRARLFNVRHLISLCVYLIVTKVSEIPLHPGMGNYKLLSRKALQAALEFRTYEPLLELMVAHAGFKPGFVDVIRRPRPGTASAYSFRAAIGFILNLMVNYSSLFFQTLVLVGTFCLIGAPLLLILLASSKYFPLIASLVLSLQASMLLIAAGITGYYIRNLQKHGRKWPVYVVEEII
jgi:dolichol-phosphate mannosyltransferase